MAAALRLWLGHSREQSHACESVDQTPVVRGATVARGAAGPVVGWGEGSYEQSTPPPSVDGTAGGAAEIASGVFHSCAIRSGAGAVVCWGDDTFGKSTPPPAVDGTSGGASAVSLSAYHTCAIQSVSNAVVCWRYDGLGQASPPHSVNGTSGSASAIGAGYGHSCAIQSSNGGVVCWGSNSFGGTTPPDSVNGTLGSASAIGSAYNHSCAIQSGTGAVVCWGYDVDGQSSPPDSVNGISGGATEMAVGTYHGCAIWSGTGAVVCWENEGTAQSSPPDSVNGMAGGASAIGVGLYHSCAIRSGTDAVVCGGATLAASRRRSRPSTVPRAPPARLQSAATTRSRSGPIPTATSSRRGSTTVRWWRNADQADGGVGPVLFEAPADGVGDACDNCVNVGNPRLSADFVNLNPWATLTGAQRDDDHDGYGNTCDGNFNGSFTTTAADTAQYKASIGDLKASDVCGTAGNRPCAIFDINSGNSTESSAGGINAADTARFKQLTGFAPGPRCATCPRACQAGTVGSRF